MHKGEKSVYVPIDCVSLFVCIHVLTTGNSGLTNPAVDLPRLAESSYVSCSCAGGMGDGMRTGGLSGRETLSLFFDFFFENISVLVKLK